MKKPDQELILKKRYSKNVQAEEKGNERKPYTLVEGGGSCQQGWYQEKRSVVGMGRKMNKLSTKYVKSKNPSLQKQGTHQQSEFQKEPRSERLGENRIDRV